ncbi:MAG: FHA domain-containing protein [Lachnospiraceae bacterium]|nr:FHA domain-containing protein [Lachnospiraceae bacterium]
MAQIKGGAVVMQSEANENGIQVFVRDLPKGSKIHAQIGTIPATNIDIVDEIEIHTLILIDNSLSITEKNREKITLVLRQFFEQKSEQEKVSLAVFGEEISYLTKQESDSDKLSKALERIEYKNQESFLTDILYEELQSLDLDDGYVRLIIATDGVDNRTIGYTRTELQDALKQYEYPVYSLGAIYKENYEELENLFALSRMTEGKYFLLDDYEEYGEIVTGLNDSITGVQIHIPSEYQDGSEKNLLLSIETEPANVELKKQVTMPFSIQGEDDIKEQEELQEERDEEEVREVSSEVSAAISEEEEEPVAVTEITPTTGGLPIPIGVLIGGGIGLLAVIVAVTTIIILRTKKEKQKKENQNQSTYTPPPLYEQNEKTWMIESNQRKDLANDNQRTLVLQNGFDEERTMCLDEDGEGTVCLSSAPYTILLRDRNDSFKEFRHGLQDSLILGRLARKGADIVLDYEPTVSGRHCKISVENGQFFVEDLNSSNKTYVDGMIVEDRRSFISGSILKMGKLEMIVEIL